jgi:hypothetical protein
MFWSATRMVLLQLPAACCAIGGARASCNVLRPFESTVAVLRAVEAVLMPLYRQWKSVQSPHLAQSPAFDRWAFSGSTSLSRDQILRLAQQTSGHIDRSRCSSFSDKAEWEEHKCSLAKPLGRASRCLQAVRKIVLSAVCRTSAQRPQALRYAHQRQIEF